MPPGSSRPIANDEHPPPAAKGAGQPLPAWARMLAVEAPRTTATLAGDDWSSFPAAGLVVLNASRYHDMTRISNGFQPGLGRENVFHDDDNTGPSRRPEPSLFDKR